MSLSGGLSLGLGGGLNRLGAGVGIIQPIPPVAAGQTLIFRETWDAARSTASPGPWSSWTDGAAVTLTADVPGGPTVYAIDGTTRRRACLAVEQPTAAQVTAGYVIPHCYYTVTHAATNGNAVCCGGWVRPGPRVQYGSASASFGRSVFQITNTAGTNLGALNVSVSSSDPTRFTFNGHCVNAGVADVYGASASLPVGEWYQVWLAYVRGGALGWWYSCPALGIVATAIVETTSATSGSGLRFGLVRSTGTTTNANQPWFSGQIGPISVYNCGTSYATASAGASDYITPGSGRTVVATTFADAVTQINRSVVMGGARMLRDATGSYADTDDRTSASANDRRDLLYGCADGSTTHNPAYDRITLPAGVDRPASDTAWSLRGVPLGLRIQGAGEDPATGTDLRGTEDLANSWTDMAAAGTYPVFRYDGAVRTNAHAWAPGRVELAARFAANFTAAGPLLDDYPYQCWVDSTGILYVSCPVGQTPGGMGTWERCRGSGGSPFPDLGGAWVSDVCGSGMGRYSYQQTGTDRLSSSGYVWYTSASLYTATVLQSLRAYGHSKHLFARVSSINRGAVAFLRPRFGGQSPRQDGTAYPSTYSVGGGDYSPLVSYSGGSGTPGTAVDVYDEPDRVSGFFYAVAGSAQGTGEDQPAQQGPLTNKTIFYTHGSEASGISWPFALIAFRWASVINDFFASGSPPTVPVSGATYPDVGSNYADFQVNGVSNPA